MRALFEASEIVTRREFERFAAELMPNPDLGMTLAWMPAVSGGHGFENSPEYVFSSAALKVPLREVRGRLDVQRALQTALVTGGMVAATDFAESTPPGAPSITIVTAVYRSQTYDVNSRRENFRGYIVAVLSVKALLERGITFLTPGGIDVTLLDASRQNRILYFHPSRTGGRRTRPQASPDMRFSDTLNIAGRDLIVLCDSAPQYFVTGYSRDGWVILFLGVAATALCAWWLWDRLRRTEQVERLVDRRTKQLAAARDEALEASKLKSQFLANVSHEVRTPLNGIYGVTGMLLSTNLDREQREFAETIQQSSISLLAVVNDLLDMSRIETGQWSIESARFSVPDLVRAAVATVSDGAARKGLKTEFQFAARTPEWVTGDADRVKQVLLNLLANAVKFTDAGTVGVRVSLEKEDPACQTLRFAVHDTGIGVPEGARELIFRRFAQADGASTRRHGGLGLGLAISQQIAKLMQGDIGVESQPGKGSTFWFTAVFERCSAEERVESGPLPAPARTPQVSNQPNGAARVLLVEDNPVNRKVAGHMLAKLGYSFDEAANGREAVGAVERRQYAAILMDCQMPVMDGFEATAKIRIVEGTLRRTPIIAITANAMKGDQERCLQMGMDDYLAKPIQIASLSSLLARWTTAAGHSK